MHKNNQDLEQLSTRLTDKAATPDTEFIKKLHVDIIRISSGNNRFDAGLLASLKHFVAIAAVSAVLITGFATVQSEQPTSSTIAPIVASDVVTGNSRSPITRQLTAPFDEVDRTEDSSGSGLANGIRTEVNQNATQSSLELIENSELSSTNNSEPVITIIENLNYRVSFWNHVAFTTPPTLPDRIPEYVIDQIDALDFNWGSGSPVANTGVVQSDYFSARATTTTSLEPGEYKLSILVNDGVRVFVNGELLLDRWTNSNGAIRDEVVFEVAETSSTDFKFEMYESKDSARFEVTLSQIL